MTDQLPAGWAIETVTCHTTDCINADVPIQLAYEIANPAPVICGPCGNPIDDVQRPSA